MLYWHWAEIIHCLLHYRKSGWLVLNGSAENIPVSLVTVKYFDDHANGTMLCQVIHFRILWLYLFKDQMVGIETGGDGQKAGFR